MKKIASRCLPAFILLALPTAVLADASVDSTSIIRFSQDNRPGFSTKTFIPATQFLGADFTNLGDGNLSLHVHGWGRVDLADRSFDNKDTGGALNYAYARYRMNQANTDLRIGRFMLSEGIINEQVDGLSFHTDLPLGFGLTSFGGATVATAHLPGEHTDGKGDGIFGGRINYRYGGKLDLGISGIYESNAPNLSNPQLAAAGFYGNRRLVGGDVWFSPVRMVEVMGHSSYNTETERVAEHTYLLNIKPAKGLVLSGEFNEHRERDLYYSSIFFAKLLENPNEKSRTIGASASYELDKNIELAADYKHYKRDIGNADRFGGDLRVTLLDKHLRTGLGYHYLRAGSEFAVNPAAATTGCLHEWRGYALYQRSSYIASLDGIAYVFRQKVEDMRAAWEVTGSLGYRITPALTVSGDMSYGQNPQLKDDLKGLIRVTYNMNFTAKGGTK